MSRQKLPKSSSDSSSDIENLIHFLQESPTAWHAVHNISCVLTKAGFEEITEDMPWNLVFGKKYFVTRNDSSLFAFILPQKKPKNCVVLGTHTDSPALKLKPNSEFYSNNYILFGTESYGEPLLSSWLNRDLGIAGRVITEDKNNRLTSNLVNITHAPCILPQLAVHLDRDVNDKGLILNRQQHFSVIAALGKEDSKKSYLHFLLTTAIKNKTILGHDLFLYPLDPPKLIGNNKELLSAYRIDNLASAHAALIALLHASQCKTAESSLKAAVFWDNEEIGSKTAQGADSLFFNDTLQRICTLLKLSNEEQGILRASSLNVSIDLAHATHPNYPNKHEPQHPILLGEGIVLKSNANMRYATDAISAAIVASVCHKKKIPFQRFVNRTDMPCGSTIGPIHASKSGMRTVDIGCPELSMHSSRELMSSKDQLHMYTLLKALLVEDLPKCS